MSAVTVLRKYGVIFKQLFVQLKFIYHILYISLNMNVKCSSCSSSVKKAHVNIPIYF